MSDGVEIDDLLLTESVDDKGGHAVVFQDVECLFFVLVVCLDVGLGGDELVYLLPQSSHVPLALGDAVDKGGGYCHGFIEINKEIAIQ
jgi:hypothetical protein